MPAPTLDFADIQGLIVRPYAMGFFRLLLLRWMDAKSGRALLGRLAPEITSAQPWTTKPAFCVNVGLSFAGLAALGMAKRSLSSFPDAFRAGVTGRADRIGDTGANAPEHWEPGLNDQDTHALVIVFAQDPATRDAQSARLTALLAPAGGGVSVVSAQNGDASADHREHFGYRDGFSQPVIAGGGLEGQPEGGGDAPIAPGEFLLGLPDELGVVPGSQPVPASLAKNGSFVALRKLHEDVAGFRHYLADNAARLTDGDPELLAAKMMGRWRSGAPLALAPTADDPALAGDRAKNNAFNYKNDPRGFACPFGAHVRRVNPRDEAAHPARRHRLMRRGLPYGPPLLPPNTLVNDGVDRGVLLLMICADIERQFEFIQQVWINQGIFVGLGRERDPIAGSHDDTLGMTINRFPIARHAPALPRFVTTRGAGYFFLPGLSALRLLASGRRATGRSTPAAA